jgi:protein-S-isoprenylcysteine O-methyltransferase Ste14
METSLLTLATANFLYVCILPFIFFKQDGKWNFMWLLTASPYVAYPILLYLGKIGTLEAQFFSADVVAIMQLIAPILFVISISLISQTRGTHKIPLALWHQDNDAPVEIITYGPYAKIRHPFYTSFILSLIAGFIVFPHVLTGAITISAWTLLNFTAAKEETKLSGSEFGQKYKDYITATGRFFPRLT